MQEKQFAVKTSGLHKTFGKCETAVDVIKNLDFSLPQGKFEAIMGPSGSGKSTLLHLIAGLLTPDSGTISIGNNKIHRHRRDKSV